MFDSAKKAVKDEIEAGKERFRQANAETEQKQEARRAKEAEKPKKPKKPKKARSGAGLVRAATTPSYMAKYEALDIAERTNELLFEQNRLLEKQLAEMARINELLSKLAAGNGSS